MPDLVSVWTAGAGVATLGAFAVRSARRVAPGGGGVVKVVREIRLYLEHRDERGMFRTSDGQVSNERLQLYVNLKKNRDDSDDQPPQPKVTG